MRLILWVIGLLFLAQIASAATIFGTVYDLSLEQATNIEVSISTVPEQRIIAVNGRYSFHVPPGSYELKAKQMQNDQIIAQVAEEVAVVQDGAFVHDLILEPFIQDDEKLVTGIDSLDVEALQLADKKTNYTMIIIFVALVLIIGFLIYRVNKVMKTLHESVKPKGPDTVPETHKETPVDVDASAVLPDDLQEVVDFIREQQGRTTQKEIRLKFPQSEAKVSLMIAELEKKGLVEKIKKGRGNVIILKSTQ